MAARLAVHVVSTAPADAVVHEGALALLVEVMPLALARDVLAQRDEFPPVNLGVSARLAVRAEPRAHARDVLLAQSVSRLAHGVIQLQRRDEAVACRVDPREPRAQRRQGCWASRRNLPGGAARARFFVW